MAKCDLVKDLDRRVIWAGSKCHHKKTELEGDHKHRRKGYGEGGRG